MMMAICHSDIAGEIKRRLTMREVVEFYGFHPDRSGFIQCPFHKGDNHGSLKIYDENRGWHCFGCHTGGTVIDFVMKLFDLGFRQACLRLNMDFNLRLTEEQTDRRTASAVVEARKRAEREKAARDAEYRQMAAEHLYWWQAKQLFSPSEEDMTAGFIHPLYAEAVKQLPILEDWLDENMGR